MRINRLKKIAIAAVLLAASLDARGDAPATRYTINTNTVRDNETGLLWQRGETAYSDTWTNMSNVCNTLSLDGVTSGWRLPTKAEGETLFDFTATGFALNQTIFPITGSQGFWTSTVYAEPGGSSYHWTVEFYGGGSSYAQGPQNTDSVRCVHN